MAEWSLKPVCLARLRSPHGRKRLRPKPNGPAYRTEKSHQSILSCRRLTGSFTMRHTSGVFSELDGRNGRGLSAHLRRELLIATELDRRPFLCYRGCRHPRMSRRLP